MGQVVEHLQPIAHDVVGFFALDIDHEADAACVVLKAGLVKTLLGGELSQLMHLYARFVWDSPLLAPLWRRRLLLAASPPSSSSSTSGNATVTRSI